MNRRRFLISSSQAFIAAPWVGASVPAHAAENSRFALALSQYSLRALIQDGTLDPLDFPAFTIETFGIKAIDLWEGGLPKEKLDDKSYLEKMRNNASEAGTDLFLLMSGVLDAAPEKREASLQSVLPSIGRAKTLGCDFVRIFLRAPGKEHGPGLKASVEALKAYADAAAEKGVTVAIEPGASFLSQQGAFLADVAETLDHPACKLMPDFGKLKDNVYDGTEAMLPYTATISCKMHSFDENGQQPDFDYVRLMKMIAESDYKGYLAIEWEGHKLKPVEGVKASKKLIESALAQIG